MATPFTIVGIGEALFDIVGNGQHPGGAPLNAAVHAHQLGRPTGGRGVLVSRVGQDGLGEQIAGVLRGREMTCDYLQTDPDHATGRAYVEHDDAGEPTYDIPENAAWDLLQYDTDLDPLAMACQGICFGSLAQRHAQSRNTIYRFLDTSRARVKLFDANLRRPFFDRQHVRRSCELATVVKANMSELDTLTEMLSLGDGQADDRAKRLLERYELRMVVLTRGQAGTVLYTPDGRHEGEPASYPPADNADAVGAGDACAAAVLVGLATRMPPGDIATLANHAGAFVASQPGATPDLPKSILSMIGA